jgi:zinc transport system ATP-binding protein
MVPSMNARVLGEKVLGLRGVSVAAAGRPLIQDVSLAIRAGEIVTLIGPNGSGKTTTAKVALGILHPDRGAVWRQPGLTIGYVPQRLRLDATFPLTVGRFMTLTARHSRQEVAAALDAVNLGSFAAAQMRSLSGGEFQRALLARALVRRPRLLVLDEPVQGVDFTGEIALYELIRKLRDQIGCAILLISHDLHIVMSETDTVVCLNGHVCCQGTPESVARSPEYATLFGPKAAQILAVYRHDHDHVHMPDGTVRSAASAGAPIREAGDA